MTGHRDLDEFLRTDPQDIGSGEAIELLHGYADLHITDPDEAARRYPGVLTHLRACGPATAARAASSEGAARYLKKCVTGRSSGWPSIKTSTFSL